ncbi:MAG: hypothetical protein CMP23_03325 [Rickettsiales bacterium]|nr:hypothetical protein [Rickettsiales bacterium]|tara:strand:+ start:1494 stop:1760 length:267 start_codon:yes stop_codon:yes gene_type:complete
MGLVTSYLFSSLNDGALPYLREPVLEVFARVMEHKGVTTRESFRELRDRSDMVEYQLRKAKKSVGELDAELQELAEGLGVELGGAGEE